MITMLSDDAFSVGYFVGGAVLVSPQSGSRNLVDRYQAIFQNESSEALPLERRSATRTLLDRRYPQMALFGPAPGD